MNFRLVEKLEKAGFPKKFVYREEGISQLSYDIIVENPPTLEELIEACGDRFEELTRVGHKIKPKWSAIAYSCEECGYENMLIGRGSTSLEAVANLYLEINKN